MSARRLPTAVDAADAREALAAHLSAAEALLLLADRLRGCEPRARHFVGDALFHAQNEHRGRLDALNLIRIELAEIMRSLQAQAGGTDAEEEHAG